METKELIRELSALGGPSGFEAPAAARIAELLRPLADEVKTDRMGNVIAVKSCGTPNARRLMLEAHMDEIGLIVTGYDKGFLRFATLGGVDPRMLPALEVRVLADEPCYGVIDTMPPHVLSAEEMDKAFAADKLRINVGMAEDEAKARIPLGTPVVFATGCTELGETRLCGKSLDDRACVAILIKTLEAVQNDKLDMDLILLISTQEEVGGRGATTGTFAMDPDYAVAVDVTHAHTPDAKKSETLEMCGGAAIGVGPNMNHNITNALIGIAKENNWPYQIEVMRGSSGTDGWEIQISREGVSTAVVSLPLRYMHTPVEVIDVEDAENIIRLLAELVRKAGEVL
ncbi:MAG: M20/M25/M40 family metallo-hydrolase [Oscillospiraceae bacterium]|nr:M20/M25/M40 family metallo-hydrolase [Oscillospiraceae bacterium]